VRKSANLYVQLCNAFNFSHKKVNYLLVFLLNGNRPNVQAFFTIKKFLKLTNRIGISVIANLNFEMIQNELNATFLGIVVRFRLKCKNVLFHT
jgi:hypothetical protein